jgi:hypothetical protein
VRGGTNVTVVGTGFNMVDRNGRRTIVKCRFGDKEVVGVLVSTSEIRCRSP